MLDIKVEGVTLGDLEDRLREEALQQGGDDAENTQALRGVAMAAYYAIDDFLGALDKRNFDTDLNVEVKANAVEGENITFNVSLTVPQSNPDQTELDAADKGNAAEVERREAELDNELDKPKSAPVTTGADEPAPEDVASAESQAD